jgi:hypothetical protein
VYGASGLKAGWTGACVTRSVACNSTSCALKSMMACCTFSAGQPERSFLTATFTISWASRSGANNNLPLIISTASSLASSSNNAAAITLQSTTSGGRSR